MCTRSSFLHCPKAPSAISVTPSGMATETSSLHSENAATPMRFIPAGRTTLLSLFGPVNGSQNALSAISFTPSGTMTSPSYPLYLYKTPPRISNFSASFRALSLSSLAASSNRLCFSSSFRLFSASSRAIFICFYMFFAAPRAANDGGRELRAPRKPGRQPTLSTVPWPSFSSTSDSLTETSLEIPFSCMVTPNRESA